MQASCAIIIPVYNEAGAIRDTVTRIQKICAQVQNYAFEIICINDGSKDDSANILSAIKGITVLTHDVNRGYGAALRTGLDYCTHEWVFIIDADGTYPLEDLVRLLDSAKGAGVDMVVGNRQGAGISHSPLHQLARWILRKMVHGLTGVMVPDLNSGMRLFRKALYSEFRHLLPLGFSFTTTLTVASLYSGRRVRYIPVHYQRRIGHSNIKPLQNFFGFAILIVRLASYFDPLRFFLPAAIGLFVLGVLRAIRDVIVVNHFGVLAAILLLTAFQVFVLGVIADVIVRRFLVVPSAPQRPDTGIEVVEAAAEANQLPQPLPSAIEAQGTHLPSVSRRGATTPGE
jgi:glycosyltransferase involved in cell wall biosynthesis